MTPYQARALTIPVSPDTGTDQAGGSELITTAASESARKSATSQPAERSGGRVRHHQLAVPPWLSSSANRISAGSAPRNGQEKGSRATPNVKVTSGDISSPAHRVSMVPEPSRTTGRGRTCPCGQASQARAASSTLRAITTTIRVNAKRGQVPPNPNSQRRSWKTASGARAVTSGARTRAEGTVALTAAASAIGTAAPRMITPAARRSPGGGGTPRAPAAGSWHPVKHRRLVPYPPHTDHSALQLAGDQLATRPVSSAPLEPKPAAQHVYFGDLTNISPHTKHK